MARAGEAGVLTHTWKGQCWAAYPVVNVSDSDELTVLYIPPGSKILGSTSKGIRDRDGLERSERLLRSMETGVWNPVYMEAPWPVLLLCPREAWWYVNITWFAENEPLGWKVDAVRPLRETDYGYDSMDLILDILAEPDLRSWSLKDEDELRLAADRRILTPEEVRYVRAGIDEAGRRIKDGLAPFDLKWLSWAPAHDYPIPKLPQHLLNKDTDLTRPYVPFSRALPEHLLPFRALVPAQP